MAASLLTCAILANAVIAVAAALRVPAPETTKFEISCYMKDDPDFETGGAKGKSYRGLATHTVGGRLCQKWTSNVPHPAAASIVPIADVSEKPDPDAPTLTTWGNGIGNHNYCRNPDQSEEKPWCYTADATMEKEVCDIPECPKHARDWMQEAEELSMNLTAGLDCKCAKQLYGSTTTTKDTYVPLSTLELSKTETLKLWKQKELVGASCRCPDGTDGVVVRRKS